MRRKLGLSALAVVLGLLASWTLARALPGLELDAYDDRLLLDRDFLTRDIPMDPRVVLAATKEETDPGQQTSGQQAHQLFLSLAGQSEARDTGWTLAKDVQVLHNLVDAGVTGICWRRHYEGEDPAELKTLEQQLQASKISLLGALFLRPEGNGQRRAGSDLAPPLDSYQPATSIDSCPDSDGTCRRAYLALFHQGNKQPIPSAALLLMARLKGVQTSDIHYAPDDIQVGSVVIPCQRNDEGYLMRVRFPVERLLSLKAQTADYTVDYMAPVSLPRMLDTKDPLFRLIKGRAVLIGDLRGEAVDERHVPFLKLREFQIQACLLDTLLGHWFMQPLTGPQSLGLQLAFLVFLSLALRSTRKYAVMLLWLGAVMAVFAGLNFWLFTRCYLAPLIGPLFGMVVVLAVTVIIQSLDTLRHLTRFGGRAAADAAMRMDKERLFKSFEREATILFINLPEHLKTLERVGAPELFPRRKEYSKLVTHVVLAHGGKILDFQADFLMVGFNVEESRVDPDHAMHAVEAAVDLERRVGELKGLWLEALEQDSTKCYSGICTGLVAIGFVGAREHKKAPAAIGDTTNVAARLLGAAKKMHVDVLISEPTFEMVKGRVRVTSMPPVSLKGKTNPVPVYQLDGLGAPETVAAS